MKDPIRILSVEDDPLQAEWIRQTVEEKIGGVDIAQIRTESEFLTRLPEIAIRPPDLILMDVMLRWADPSPNIPERPPDVRAGGMRIGGLRCLRHLLGDERTRRIPVILYTVLNPTDLDILSSDSLPPHVKYVQKDSDPSNLMKAISEL